MKRTLWPVMALFLLLGSTSVLAETIGVVNIQKVNAVLKFKNIIKARVVYATREQGPVLTDMSSKISTKENQLRNKNSSLSADQKKTIETEVAAERQKFFDLQRSYQLKTVTLYNKESNDIKNKVEQTLGVIAEKHHVHTVINEADVAYATRKIDLTDELISELKKIYKTPTGDQDD